MARVAGIGLIAEREAIQDKVHAAFEAGSVQAGRDMMKANQMPIPPAVLVMGDR